MSTILKGIAASNGIAIAKAYRLVEPDLSFEKNKLMIVQMRCNDLKTRLLRLLPSLK